MVEPISGSALILISIAKGAGMRLGDEGTKRILNYIDRKGYRKTEDDIRKAVSDYLNDPTLDTACYKCNYKWKRRVSHPRACPNCGSRHVYRIR